MKKSNKSYYIEFNYMNGQPNEIKICHSQEEASKFIQENLNGQEYRVVETV